VAPARLLDGGAPRRRLRRTGHAGRHAHGHDRPGGVRRAPARRTGHCTVGRRATDGSFDDFVAALGVPAFEEGGVTYRTRHGEILALDLHGPFAVDGRPADLDADGRVPVP
jgi:hypothetical protein